MNKIVLAHGAAAAAALSAGAAVVATRFVIGETDPLLACLLQIRRLGALLCTVPAVALAARWAWCVRVCVWNSLLRAVSLGLQRIAPAHTRGARCGGFGNHSNSDTYRGVCLWA